MKAGFSTSSSAGFTWAKSLSCIALDKSSIKKEMMLLREGKKKGTALFSFPILAFYINKIDAKPLHTSYLESSFNKKSLLSVITPVMLEMTCFIQEKKRASEIVVEQKRSKG